MMRRVASELSRSREPCEEPRDRRGSDAQCISRADLDSFPCVCCDGKYYTQAEWDSLELSFSSDSSFTEPASPTRIDTGADESGFDDSFRSEEESRIEEPRSDPVEQSPRNSSSESPPDDQVLVQFASCFPTDFGQNEPYLERFFGVLDPVQRLKYFRLPRPRCRRHREKKLSDPYANLCLFEIFGQCRYGPSCARVHGDPCEYCGLCCLDPGVKKYREFHVKECKRRLTSDMRRTFRNAASRGKACGICLEKVLKKAGETHERRFGILPNCKHVFCIGCIRTWREQTVSVVNRDNVKACPECRTPSDYVIPSKYWVEDQDEKEKLLEDFRRNAKKKHCKYFLRGEESCPFGNRCFYRHELPDGTSVDIGPPRARRVPTYEALLSFSDTDEEDDVDEEIMSIFASGPRPVGRSRYRVTSSSRGARSSTPSDQVPRTFHSVLDILLRAGRSSSSYVDSDTVSEQLYTID